jgi:hypothetical protein
MVLDTGKDGSPTVHTIKITSILYGQVCVGDRLLYVDGVDVSTMLAIDVSKMIAAKKHRSSRRLVFGRPSKLDLAADKR